MSFRLRTLLTRLFVRFRYILYILSVFLIFGVLVHYFFFNVPYCFKDRSLNVASTQRGELLVDVLTALRKPTPGRSIFFHETTCRHTSSLSSVHKMFATCNNDAIPVKLTARQACAIESAARNNPQFDIFVLFASPVYHDDLRAHAIIEAILSYSNVNLRNMNIWTYAAGTPIFNWFKRRAVFRSRFVSEHFSDLLRYLTLYRWGGTYLDLDIVMLQSIQQVPPNFVGAQTNIDIAAGVMNFAAEGFGHEIAKLCLADFERNFDGNDWANNGPGVITRVMQRLCGTENVLEMLEMNRCQGFRVYPREAFYEINWLEWERFFNERYSNHTLNRVNESYVIHLWNKYTSNHLLKVGSNAAYGKLAEKHCPKVYAAAGEYF